MTKIKLLSWNVNSLTQREKNGQLDWFYNENFDILCLQETKLKPNNVPKHHMISMVTTSTIPFLKKARDTVEWQYSAE